MEYKTMRNKTKVPMLGLGCYKSEAEEGIRAVRSAIEVGYRHIDTANFYENEVYVGKGIRESGIERSELFVVSKIWPTSYKTPETAVEYSMKALNIDYIDMYLLHWPGLNEYARYHAFEALLKYKEKGYFKEIGVSNFKKEHLEALTEKFGIVPVMNQIELSPWLQKKEDYQYCLEKDITMTACVPFAKGFILSEPQLERIAEKHNKNVGQVILRWNIQRGNCVIPKSSKPHRIADNFNIFDFELDEEDMSVIAGMENGNAYCSDSSVFTGDFWNIEEYLLDRDKGRIS